MAMSMYVWCCIWITWDIHFQYTLISEKYADILYDQASSYLEEHVSLHFLYIVRVTVRTVFF